MLLPPTCLSFGLPVSPACLSVSQTSMDDSDHKGNAGQWGGGGRLSLQHNLKKRGLYRTSIFRGGCLKRGGDFFQGKGVQLSHNKLKSQIFNDKKSL